VPVAVPSAGPGRVLVMPGVGNTTFHLGRFVAATEAQLPRSAVEVRPWGEPFMTVHNLRAHERNVATAESIAAEIADYEAAAGARSVVRRCGFAGALGAQVRGALT
jgi:hypothetical protein